MAVGMEAVECELKYSGVVLALLLVAAAGAVALVLALPLAAPLRLGLGFYILGTTARAARELLRPSALRLRTGRRIDVLQDGAWCEGEVRDGSFVMPCLTIVRWRPCDARWDRTLLLVPGMANDDDLRKIRVILRWG
jgi:hypothetical protein